MKKNESGDGRADRSHLVSWYSILTGCVLVWILHAIPWLMELIGDHKIGMMLTFAGAYLLILLYTVVWKRRRDESTVLMLIMLGGFLLRTAYVLAAPYDISRHDLGSFMGLDTGDFDGGHFGYIEYLYKFRHLPDFDPRGVWSFGNPPGFHIVGALALGLSGLFGMEAPLCYESIQVVTLLFSNLTVLMLYHILEELPIGGRYRLALAALLSAHPFFMVLSVTLNNDCMMTYFLAVAILYTMRWWKDPDLINIMVIALALGLAMFTKLNAATISFGIGMVFLCVFWRNRADWKNFFGQFSSFLVICAPIGLLSPIRNMLKFDMPLLYIQSLPAGSDQYIPDSTLLSRLGLPGPDQMSYPFASFDVVLERNVWIQTMRTALFDEIRVEDVNEVFYWIALILLWMSIALCILMHAGFLWSIIKKGMLHWEMKLFLAVGYGAMLISYAKFCMDEPFICTMNYRYIPLGILFPCIGTGIFMQHQQEKGSLPGSVAGLILLCAMAAFIVCAAAVDVCLVVWSYVPL